MCLRDRFLNVQLTAGGLSTLPPDLESRRAYELLEDEFPAFTASFVPIVVVFEDGQEPFSKSLATEVSQVCEGIRGVTGVIAVEHPLCTPGLFDVALEQWPAEAQLAWSTTVSDSVAMIYV